MGLEILLLNSQGPCESCCVINRITTSVMYFHSAPLPADTGRATSFAGGRRGEEEKQESGGRRDSLEEGGLLTDSPECSTEAPRDGRTPAPCCKVSQRCQAGQAAL